MSFRSGTALRTLRTLRLFSQVSQKTRNPSFAQVLGLSVGTGAGLIFLYVEWKKSQSPFPEAVHRPLRNALYWSEKNAPVDQILPWYQKAWEEARMLKDQNLLDPQALIGLQVEYANYLMRIGKRNEAQNIYREALNDHVKNFQTTKLTEAPWDQVKQASTLGILLADTLHPDSEEAESLYRWSFRIIGDWLKTSSMDLKQLEKQYVDAFAVAMERLASYYDAQDRLKESFAIYYSLYDLLKQSNESKLSVDHQCKIAEVCSHLADNSFNLQQPDTSMKWINEGEKFAKSGISNYGWLSRLMDHDDAAMPCKKCLWALAVSRSTVLKSQNEIHLANQSMATAKQLASEFALTFDESKN